MGINGGMGEGGKGGPQASVPDLRRCAGKNKMAWLCPMLKSKLV